MAGKTAWEAVGEWDGERVQMDALFAAFIDKRYFVVYNRINGSNWRAPLRLPPFAGYSWRLRYGPEGFWFLHDASDTGVHAACYSAETSVAPAV